MKVVANYSSRDFDSRMDDEKGKRIGRIIEYENGKALQRENWDSILE